MHSSRMRTVRCSGRLERGRVSAQEECLPRKGVCLGGVCWGVYTPQNPEVDTPPPWTQWQTQRQTHLHPDPEADTPYPCEQNYRQVSKHYLSATTLRTVKMYRDETCTESIDCFVQISGFAKSIRVNSDEWHSTEIISTNHHVTLVLFTINKSDRYYMQFLRSIKI